MTVFFVLEKQSTVMNHGLAVLITVTSQQGSNVFLCAV